MFAENSAKIVSILKPVKNFLEANLALKWLCQATLGSLFLAVCSQVAIVLPFTPVPVSMQTLGVFLLVLMQGKASVLSIALYLSQASMGLPVLAGARVDPFWMLGATGGYLVGFLLCAYPAAAICGQSPSWKRVVASVVLAQAIILLFGTAWLASYVGFDKAYALGVAPFWVGTLIKAMMVVGSFFPLRRVKQMILCFYKGL